jgi:hypothetical protein
MSLAHSQATDGDTLWTAVVAVLLALLIAAWVYGIYCYVQMVRHRRPGVPASSMLWPAEFLTEQGLRYRRRALKSYAAFALLALLLVVASQLLPG